MLCGCDCTAMPLCGRQEEPFVAVADCQPKVQADLGATLAAVSLPGRRRPPSSFSHSPRPCRYTVEQAAADCVCEML